MADRRYQVFVSSTFRDLIKERQAVLDGILQAGHFPAGMETFPAANGTPWEVIQRVIDESDYYVVIVGGKYGSTLEGVSYTEREYDYAVSRGKCVLPFLHGNPGAIPRDKSELDPVTAQKLEAFRARLEALHHRKFWLTPLELKAYVIIALTLATSTQPAPGWIRGDGPDATDLLRRLADLQARYDSAIADMESLRTRLAESAELSSVPSGTEVVPLTFAIPPEGDEKELKHAGSKAETVTCTLDELFFAIAPKLRWPTPHTEVEAAICRVALNMFAGTERALQFPQIVKADGELNYFSVSIEPPSYDRAISGLVLGGLIEPTTVTRQQHSYLFSRAQNQQGTVMIPVGGWKLTDRGLKKFAKAAISRDG